MAKKEKAAAPAAKAKVSKAATGGKSRGKRKLTDDQVKIIVVRFNEGAKMAALAREFSVSNGSIAAIVKGRTYVWLTGIGAKEEMKLAA